MSNSVSQVMGGVRLLCTFGSPPTEPTEEQLSGSHILTTLNDIETALSNEAVLSQQNQFLQAVLLGTPGARLVDLSAPNYNSIVQVEYQVDPTYDRWVTIKIINRVELNDAEAQNIRACAVFGTPPQLLFNFIPSVELPLFQIRVWYETSASDQIPAETPRLNPNFYNLWKYQTAIICREVFMNLPPKQALIDQKNQFYQQYIRYANKSPDQRATVKPAAYGTDNIDAMYEPWRYS